MTFQERYQYNPQTDLLGKGGFARVYKAWDNRLKREVALKVFNATEKGKYDVIEEITRAIKLVHPNILRYYDADVLENTNAFGENEILQIGVMELANAGDLKQFVKKNPNSPLLSTLLQQVLSGLEYLHKKGEIHRDLKPQNILLHEEDGELIAKISDFGISKNMDSETNSSSMAIGSIEYMAPEQFNPAKYGINNKISTNVDLWSFGIMVHELLTDKPLFGQRNGNTTAEQIMSAILSTDVPEGIEDLPEPYKSTVKKCLIKDAKERAQKATELIALLEGKKILSKNYTSNSNETIVLPKPQVSNIAETQVLHKEKKRDATVNVVSTKTNKGKKGIIALVTIIALLGAGFWRYNSHKFDWIGEPIEGMRKVIKDKKFGFINEKGDIIGNIDYDMVHNFNEGLALVHKDGKSEFIDKTGKVTITLKRDNYAEDFNEGLAILYKNRERESYGFIDKTGKEIIPPVGYYTPQPFNEGLARARSKNGLIGYLDRAFKEVIPAKYEIAYDFSEGLAAVGNNGLIGFIDKTGKEVIPLEYDSTEGCNEGLVSVAKNGKWGYIDKTGKEIIPLEYDFTGGFSEGLASVSKNGKCGYIDKTGREVIPAKYEIAYDFSDGLAAVDNNGLIGFIDKTGKEVIPLEYDSTEGDNERCNEGLVSVAKNGKWGYIDKTGKEIIPLEYDFTGGFSEGLGTVCKNGKWGYIDKTGKELTEFK